MKMMGATLFFFSFVAAHVASQEIEVKCRRFYGFPPTNTKACPSLLADLKVEQVTVEGRGMLNISWAINIDPSTEYLTATRIDVSGETPYHCEYSPPFAQAGLIGSEQKWFHFLVKARCGRKSVEAANLPLPPPGTDHRFKFTSIEVVCPQPRVTTDQKSQVTTVETFTESTPTAPVNNNVAVTIVGGLAALMILTSCYLIYKRCGSNVATSLGFKQLSATPGVPVSVLVVYPAENSAFQRAVVALAEFLQWHGGCSVAVDMWQQEKIAALGPMRWLAEQSKAAERVLIVCPGAETSSHSPTKHSFPEASIPAAAHDLYPLILNMVASHAKAASELAKFWVVQLGKRGEKGSRILPLELRACRTFCLIKDLNKLCKSLRAERGDDKISDLLFKPAVSYSEKSTMKLREALESLRGHQPDVSTEVQPLKCVVSTL